MDFIPLEHIAAPRHVSKQTEGCERIDTNTYLE